MRKGKYSEWLEEEKLALVEWWARDGLTEQQIAHNMGIAYSTFRVWKEKFPALSAPLKRGKAVADYMVENSLFKRAIGFAVEEKRVKVNADGTKEATLTTKHIAGDVTAQIFWLKNRMPDKWKDRPVPSYYEELEDDGLIAALKSGCRLVDDMEMIKGSGDDAESE